MSGFRINPNGEAEVLAWEGDPDDDSAHQKMLDWLRVAEPAGFLDASDSLSNRTKGNLGEFITYKIGTKHIFANMMFSDPANAHTPLSDNSKTGVDIVWLHFGDTESDDWAALQEVKTTGGASLDLALKLVSDYDKLFGEQLRFTLLSRLGELKNRLEGWGQGKYVPRLTALGGSKPDSVHGIRIFPTLVHDSANNSFANMTHVRQCLIDQGWPPDVVHCWSISLSNLNNRLTRLARGQP